jgi:HAD superfamily hydrolase (TIGR01450 family)
VSDLLLGSAGPLAEAFDLALVDLDGVAYAGHEPIAHAADGLAHAREVGMRLVFVTNNASREPSSVSEQLSGLDIPAVSDDVMTAAQACARLLGDHVAPGSRVLVVGGAGLVTAVSEAGYVVVTSADDQPAAVAQGFSPGLGWADLAEAAYAVAGGAVHVASNLDLSLPTARGFAPGNGSLVGAVVAATGVTPVSAGKPSPAMYAMAVERAGAERPLVIGDRLDTDLAGARAGGYPGLHVLTGVNSARDDVLAAPGERPHFIGADLRSLAQAHQAPVEGEDGWWTCGASSARVLDGRLELRVDPAELDGVNVVRAACNAAWTFVDAGGTLRPESVPEFDV